MLLFCQDPKTQIGTGAKCNGRIVSENGMHTNAKEMYVLNIKIE